MCMTPPNTGDKAMKKQGCSRVGSSLGSNRDVLRDFYQSKPGCIELRGESHALIFRSTEKNKIRAPQGRTLYHPGRKRMLVAGIGGRQTAPSKTADSLGLSVPASGTPLLFPWVLGTPTIYHVNHRTPRTDQIDHLQVDRLDPN